MFDPAIKLFGKTIPLQDASSSSSVDSHSCSTENNGPMADRKTLKTESDVLKKPDKIIPCPRCNSLETKFCYYNNYNVNQPRHFCKKCQRYWTAGGTMRNVPVGAGRRKNKHMASQYRHIDGIPTSPLELPVPKVNLSSGLSSLKLTCNGNGSDVPLCESMVASLNLGDQKRETELNVVACGENEENPMSCVSSTSAKTELPQKMSKMSGDCDEAVHSTPKNHFPCYGSSPWMYPWHIGWNNIAAMTVDPEAFYGMNGSDINQMQWGSTPMVFAPHLPTPTGSFPFVPASYWGCMSSVWASGAWNMPWNGSGGIASPSSSSNRSGCSSSGSPTLGKHCRDRNVQAEQKEEKCLWAPKTLRIDDPTEAAKSSIWDTLGISPTKSEPILKGGIFKAFQPNTRVNCDVSDTSEVLQANPAALSRSQAFQESV